MKDKITLTREQAWAYVCQDKLDFKLFEEWFG